MTRDPQVCADLGRGFPQVDSSATQHVYRLLAFVVFARWNAECPTKFYEPAEDFLGTNAFGISSTRLTKQLVSVRRPFPQQTNPARRPQI
jgi:hypothetical protein